MTRHLHLVKAILLSAAIVAAAHAESDRYDFQFNPYRSGLDAELAWTVGTAGTLIGNWDSEQNPEGTRTKPGLFGRFGDDENLPVDITLDFAVGGDLHSATAGTFRLRANRHRNIVRIARLQADLLASGPITIAAELTLMTDNFRTRNPDSFYLGDFPITLPLGEISLDSLTIVQSEDRAAGELTPIEGDRYSFLVVPLVTLSGQITVLGNALDLPPTQVPFPLAGEVELGPVTARIVSVQPIDFSDSQNPNLALPEIPLDLPTIFPPGTTAHLLLNLTMDELSSSFTGEQRTEADGIIHNP